MAQPLSGPSAARGQDIVNGAKLAAADLNAAGFKVAGKVVQIEIVAVDDKADKEEAKKVAQGLVDQKVTAVIGHLSSDVTEVVVPIYRSGNVPQFFTSSATELTRLGQGNTFRLVANDEPAGARDRQLCERRPCAPARSRSSTKTPRTARRLAQGHDGRAGQAEQEGRATARPSTTRPRISRRSWPSSRQRGRRSVVAMLRDHQLLPLFDQMNAAGLGDVPVIGTSVAKGRSGSRPAPASRRST